MDQRTCFICFSNVTCFSSLTFFRILQKERFDEFQWWLFIPSIRQPPAYHSCCGSILFLFGKKPELMMPRRTSKSLQLMRISRKFKLWGSNRTWMRGNLNISLNGLTWVKLCSLIPSLAFGACLSAVFSNEGPLAGDGAWDHEEPNWFWVTSCHCTQQLTHHWNVLSILFIVSSIAHAILQDSETFLFSSQRWLITQNGI